MNNTASPPQLRYTDYVITDNKPGFWIQHKSDGFVCGIPYDAKKDENRVKALKVAQKICSALEQFDENNKNN